MITIDEVFLRVKTFVWILYMLPDVLGVASVEYKIYRTGTQVQQYCNRY